MSCFVRLVAFALVLTLCFCGSSSYGQETNTKTQEALESESLEALKEGKCGVFLYKWHEVKNGQEIPINSFIRNLSVNDCKLDFPGDFEGYVTLEPGESLFSTCAFTVIEMNGRVEFAQMSPNALKTAVHFLDAGGSSPKQEEQ